MKAIVLTGIKQIELRDIPEPVIQNPTDVLLKIEAIGVCGSDVHYYETGKIGDQVVQYPFIVGHECAATVKEVGSAVKHVKPGNRIVVEPAISCHNCDQCNQGRENTCRNLKFLGCPSQVGGCLCEYMIMPEDCCLPMGDKLTFGQAVLCEPLAIGLYAVMKAELPPKADIAILGAGPIGLSCMATAKAENPNASYVTDIIEERCQIAKKGGATWVGNPNTQNIVEQILEHQPSGVDVVFECAGKQETLDQAIEILKPGGKILLIGIPRFDQISLNIHKIRRKEVAIINVRRQNKCTQKCIDLIAENKIYVDFMITHHFKLEQTKQAFDMVADYRDGVVKALIEL